MYYLYIANKNKSAIYPFQIPLENLPAKKRGSNTESFVNFYGKELTFITGQTALTFSIETWIPREGVRYNFQKNNPTQYSEYINIINNAIINNEPVYLLINSDKAEIVIDGLYIIESFEEGKNKTGDTTIKFDCKEYITL